MQLPCLLLFNRVPGSQLPYTNQEDGGTEVKDKKIPF